MLRRWKHVAGSYGGPHRGYYPELRGPLRLQLGDRLHGVLLRIIQAILASPRTAAFLASTKFLLWGDSYKGYKALCWTS